MCTSTGLLGQFNQGVVSMFDAISGNQKLSEAAFRVGLARVIDKASMLNAGVANALTLQNRTIINPNIRALFRGVGLREFTFQFKMIATSPQEGRVIQDIIKLFRTELYPQAFNVPIGKSNVEAKLGFNFPNAFKIRFNFKGVENQNLPKLKECYLRTMSHTINPTGGGFKVDGKPNEIDMPLSFVENQTLDKDDIKAGF